MFPQNQVWFLHDVLVDLILGSWKWLMFASTAGFGAQDGREFPRPLHWGEGAQQQFATTDVSEVRKHRSRNEIIKPFEVKKLRDSLGKKLENSRLHGNTQKNTCGASPGKNGFSANPRFWWAFVASHSWGSGTSLAQRDGRCHLIHSIVTYKISCFINHVV